MAMTSSTMLPIGTIAADFNLYNVVTGTSLSLAKAKGEKGTLVAFICNHCPFVIHINPELSKMAKTYQPQGVNFIAISSNDINKYPLDAPNLMKEQAIKEDYSFPYLYDESQEVAKAYAAACTPDFYLFDERLKLVYRGQLDDSRPGNGQALTGTDLRSAIDAMLNGAAIDPNQKPSIGCSIKWINTN